MRLTQVKVHQELYGKANVPSELGADIRINELLASALRTKCSLKLQDESQTL